LSKPVKQSELLDAILTVFVPAAAVPERAPVRRARRSTGARGRRRLSILLAEDNPTNQKLVVTLLEHRRHAVVVVRDGRDAVRRAAEQAFDLILMDVQMPEMSGLEATAAIREREKASRGHVPIIAMTAHAMTGDRERCLEAGMDAYVSKPLRPQELFAAIDSLFASDAPAGAPPVVSQTEVEPALDGPTLLAGFGGNRKLLGDVIDVFLEDSPIMMAAIQDAAGRLDAPALVSSAHALKGSIGLFDQQNAYQTARRLERTAASGDLTGVAEVCAVLGEEVAGLRVKLGDLRNQLRR
jgi:CheY-like chemotaxis protein